MSEIFLWSCSVDHQRSDPQWLEAPLKTQFHYAGSVNVDQGGFITAVSTPHRGHFRLGIVVTVAI